MIQWHFSDDSESLTLRVLWAVGTEQRSRRAPRPAAAAAAALSRVSRARLSARRSALSLP